MTRVGRVGCALLVLALAHPAPAPAQCTPPPVVESAVENNMFSPQQEVELGNVLARQMIDPNFRIVEDPSLAQHLQQIGDRLQQGMGKPLEVRYFIVDLPVVNAFSIPGRVYVTRKMISFVRSDDELAALLAHELGHLETHQAAINMSTVLHELLGVDHVGDEADITAQYLRLFEQGKRTAPKLPRQQEEQVAADTAAVYALALAGYSPDTFVAFFDRLAQTNGKTGNWFTDLFGATSPDQRRLRDLIRNVKELPPACIKKASGGTESFAAWQGKVAEWTPGNRQGSLRGVIYEKKLSPPLRDDIHSLQFSRDGRYLLAQDTGTIYVLTRQPFQFLFSIDAPEAFVAQFTPDSKQIVFRNASSRVERWDVEKKARAELHDLVIRKSCAVSELAPDGRSIACAGFLGGLELLDGSTGEVKFSHGDVSGIDSDKLDYLAWFFSPRINLAYSPDGKYFLGAGPSFAIGIDLATMKQLPLESGVRDCLNDYFAFVGADKLFCVNPEDSRNSRLVRFPSGKSVTRAAVGQQAVISVTSGDYVVLKPVRKNALGLFDIDRNKLLFGADFAGLDVYDDTYVYEGVSGVLTLRKTTNNALVGEATLPVGNLGRVRAFDVSDDQQAVAVSGERRGAVWDLKTDKRLLYLSGFSSGALLSDSEILAHFPGFYTRPEAVALIRPNPQPAEVLLQNDDAKRAEVYGHYLFLRSAPDEKHRDGPVEYSVMEALSKSVRWRRTFDQQLLPWMTMDASSDTLGLFWMPGSKGARKELDNADVKRLAASENADEKKDGVVELVDLGTGNIRGVVELPPGEVSVRPVLFRVFRDWVVLGDVADRLLLYKPGANGPRMKLFGRVAMVSPAKGLLAVENRNGHVELWDLASGSKKSEVVFPHDIAATKFSRDGSRLFVLTRDQTAYSLDVSKLEATP